VYRYTLLSIHRGRKYRRPFFDSQCIYNAGSWGQSCDFPGVRFHSVDNLSVRPISCKEWSHEMWESNASKAAQALDVSRDKDDWTCMFHQPRASWAWLINCFPNTCICNMIVNLQSKSIIINIITVIRIITRTCILRHYGLLHDYTSAKSPYWIRLC
jgi:hypothetical protein